MLSVRLNPGDTPCSPHRCRAINSTAAFLVMRMLLGIAEVRPACGTQLRMVSGEPLVLLVFSAGRASTPAQEPNSCFPMQPLLQAGAIPGMWTYVASFFVPHRCTIPMTMVSEAVQGSFPEGAGREGQLQDGVEYDAGPQVRGCTARPCANRPTATPP